eukprot:scaffold92903_cov58-Attheya_sp.AAC.2
MAPQKILHIAGWSSCTYLYVVGKIRCVAPIQRFHVCHDTQPPMYHPCVSFARWVLSEGGGSVELAVALVSVEAQGGGARVSVADRVSGVAH